MADPIHVVAAPERKPRRGGIRTVVPFVGGQNRLALGGQVAYTSLGCGEVHDNIALCYPSVDATEQTEKLRDGVDTLTGIGPAFGLYAGVECYLGGEDYEAAARAALEAGEDRGIEGKVYDYLSALTPLAPATDIVAAVAALEQAADADYVGRPILWMSRGDAILAKGKGVIDGDDDGNLTTVTGNPVVASGEIPRGTLAITGAATVHHTDVEANRTVHITTNREMAIAERVYAVTIDCEYAQVITIGGA